MLAIIEQWESGSHTNNLGQYLLLVSIKLGLDAAVLYLCGRNRYACFLRMCSLSIVLADTVIAIFMASVWCLGAERSLVSPCFFLAFASGAYVALPLPMTCLGLLDYYLDDTCIGKKSDFFKSLKNVVLTLLVWMLAVVYSLFYANGELMELDHTKGIKALVCKVDEATFITYFVLVMFTAVICTLVPFWSSIPQWLKEADKLSEAREKQDNYQRSDLAFTSTPCAETKNGEEDFQEGTVQPRPPLWLSLTLGFGVLWMPYLAVSVACLIMGFGVPAYIAVNLLWLECTNSLLLGVNFWVKSGVVGPYSHLPENVCSWHIYWHLSKRNVIAGTPFHCV